METWGKDKYWKRHESKMDCTKESGEKYTWHVRSDGWTVEDAKKKRIRQIEGWAVYIAAVYEVTLNPIDFYSSVIVNHRPKCVCVLLSVCVFVAWQYVWCTSVCVCVRVSDFNHLVNVTLIMSVLVMHEVYRLWYIPHPSTCMQM